MAIQSELDSFWSCVASSEMAIASVVSPSVLACARVGPCQYILRQTVRSVGCNCPTTPQLQLNNLDHRVLKCADINMHPNIIQTGVLCWLCGTHLHNMGSLIYACSRTLVLI